jgi:acetyl-CoA carboxylase biotin carboxyl carrier protein
MSKNILGFDANFLKQIKGLMEETSIEEIEIEEGENRYIRVSKKKSAPEIVYSQPPVYSQQPAAEHQQQGAVPHTSKDAHKPVPAAAPDKKDQYDDDKKYYKIKSPVIGTFYSAPSPDSPPFIKMGDTVSKDSTVCIVEAMKVMNEIKADVQGKIVDILKVNSNAVLSGEALFVVQRM